MPRSGTDAEKQAKLHAKLTDEDKARSEALCRDKETQTTHSDTSLLTADEMDARCKFEGYGRVDYTWALVAMRYLRVAGFKRSLFGFLGNHIREVKALGKPWATEKKKKE